MPENFKYVWLDFAQASFAMVGSFFLAGAAMKARKRLVGWLVVVGLLVSVLQIAEVGLHTYWTEIVVDWLTPGSEILQHLGIAICLWTLFLQKDLTSNSRSINKPSLV
jgi:branched-subunit amino acid ABC-type transport system permease component